MCKYVGAAQQSRSRKSREQALGGLWEGIMKYPTVSALGFAVQCDGDVGTFKLRTWTRFTDSAVSSTVDYSGLIFTELVDVVMTCLDLERPGYQLLDGMVQPPLFD